jgi:hypothetical protein
MLGFTAVIRHVKVVENSIQIVVLHLEDVGEIFVIYFSTRSVSRPQSAELWDEWWIQKKLEGRLHGLLDLTLIESSTIVGKTELQW